MVDLHTHILPCIDDCSKSPEESIKILNIMMNSGVKRVVATPHYYRDRISVDEFLKKRKKAYDKIKNKIPEGIDVILGAEVKLEYDLHLQDLKKLAIEGTDCILIEMPYLRWDDWVFDELFKIASKHSLEIIIAHIDRYIDDISSDKIKSLFELHLKYQVNIDDLGGFFKKSQAMKLIQNNVPHFIGSDCHNLTSRPPCMGDAVKKIEKKFGKERVEHYMLNAEKMLLNKNIK